MLYAQTDAAVVRLLVSLSLGGKSCDLISSPIDIKKAWNRCWSVTGAVRHSQVYVWLIYHV